MQPPGVPALLFLFLLCKLLLLPCSPEAVAFRRRYSGDYLPYNMVYGPPYNRKLKDPKKVAEAE